MKQYPNHFNVYFVAGLANSKLNNLQEAEKMFLEAKRIKPENKKIKFILDQIQALKKN